MSKLAGKHIALLVEDLYEDPEFWYPYYRMKEAEAQVTVVGTHKTTYESKHGYPATADMLAKQASPDAFNAVIIPGGYAPDRLRRYPEVLDFVRALYHQNKIIAFICHAGWVPISAGIVKGHRVTSFFSIKDDLINAGAEWVDEPVVRDRQLISSRRPPDLPYFCHAILSALAS